MGKTRGTRGKEDRRASEGGVFDGVSASSVPCATHAFAFMEH